MRKKASLCIYLILCLLLVVCNNLKKQDSDADKGSSTIQTLSGSEANKLSLLLQSRNEYQLGTNCDLQGNIKVHLFFVDDQESRWDRDTVEQFTSKQILPGLHFLENEAKRYGVALDFSVESHTTGSKTGTPIIYEGNISKSKNHTLDIPTKIVGQFGCEDADQMYTKLYAQNDHNEVIFLFLVNKDGVSYAVTQGDGDFYHPYLEFGVVFKRHLDKDFGIDDNTHPAASVAHEILHTYGAIDMYTPIEVKKLLKPIYPRDIMLLDYLNIEDMEVGSYTAYSVGWINQAPTGAS